MSFKVIIVSFFWMTLFIVRRHFYWIHYNTRDFPCHVKRNWSHDSQTKLLTLIHKHHFKISLAIANCKTRTTKYFHRDITLRKEKEKRKEKDSTTHQVTVWWQYGDLYLYVDLSLSLMTKQERSRNICIYIKYRWRAGLGQIFHN